MGKTVLVVGAGIIGASVAWHLARAGCKVTIVDAAEPGGVATPRSFAWINASWGNPEFYFHFRRRSMAGWRRIERDIPAVAVDWCGGLMWDPPPEGLAAFAEEHARWGYGIRMVDRAGALAIEPGLTDAPDLAVHVAEEGMLEPIATTQALVAAAMAEGARLLPATRIASLATSNARVSGVVTDSGDILEADETVDCCRRRHRAPPAERRHPPCHGHAGRPHRAFHQIGPQAAERPCPDARPPHPPDP